MKKLLALCLSVVLTVSIFAACKSDQANNSSAAGSSTPGSSSSASSEVSANPNTNSGDLKEIIINTTSEPPMLNSILTTSTGSGNVLRHVVDGLVILNPSDEPIPGVAETWTVSEDGLTYTFNLRQGMKWSNGENVTANDFVFAWKTMFTSESAAPYGETWCKFFLGATEHLLKTELSAETAAKLTELGYEDIGFKAVDDYTLQITTTGPYPFFVSMLAFPNFLPINEKAYTEIGADSYATEAENIVTCGAYKMVAWNHEDSIVLEKDPTYWDAANINLDKITMVMISDAGTALNAFQAGEIDSFTVNPDNRKILEGQGYEILTYDDGSCWYFEFNTKLPGLNNAKIRQALTLAVDAESFVTNVVNNNSKVAYSFVPPAISNGEFTKAVGSLITRVTDGNYDSVKALLAEGLAEENMTKDQLNLVLIADDTSTASKYCAFFQQQFKDHLDLDVKIDQMTYKNRLTRMQQNDFSMVMAGWGPDYNDPMTFLDIFTTGNGNNHTQYANPEYDALIAKALAETNPDEREKILIECEKTLINDSPIGIIYNRSQDYVCSEGITGILHTAFTDLSLRFADVNK